jgi:hypothetical protein
MIPLILIGADSWRTKRLKYASRKVGHNIKCFGELQRADWVCRYHLIVRDDLKKGEAEFNKQEVILTFQA